MQALSQIPLPTSTRATAAITSTIEPDGTITGYASLFDVPDLGRDVVLRGAFRDSLRLRGPRGIRMLFQHDPSEPIGVWTDIAEDTRGLFVRGRLTLQVTRARDVLALVRAGALDGLSIGFRAVSARREGKTGVRRIARVDLWEISIVTFPLLPGARIAQVKASAPHPLASIRAATHLLRHSIPARAALLQARAYAPSGALRPKHHAISLRKRSDRHLPPPLPVLTG